MQLSIPPPNPPTLSPTHGIYINLQLFLAGGNFCLFVCFLLIYSFVYLFPFWSLLLLGFAGDSGAPLFMVFLAKSHGSYLLHVSFWP